MSEEFKIEIVNPEKSFLLKEDVTEVVVPAFEGEMGILKDHISIISFLKPGIIKISSQSGEEHYYVEDGILEFKNNNLSVLTSSIFNTKDIEKTKISELLTPPSIKAHVEIIYQTVKNLHKACPGNTGDWYFTGNYPTNGGNKVVNKAFINWKEGKNERAY